MDRNVRIAKQLVRLAKSLVAGAGVLSGLKSTSDIKFSNATDDRVDFRIDVEKSKKGKSPKNGMEIDESVDYFVDGSVSREVLADGSEKYVIHVEDATEPVMDLDEHDRLYDQAVNYGADTFGKIGMAGDFFEEWDKDESKVFSAGQDPEGWIMMMLGIAVDLANDCADYICRVQFDEECGYWDSMDWSEHDTMDDDEI